MQGDDRENKGNSRDGSNRKAEGGYMPFSPHLKIKRKDIEHQITFLVSSVTANYIMPKWQLM